jgi:hypothetical protein
MSATSEPSVVQRIAALGGRRLVLADVEAMLKDVASAARAGATGRRADSALAAA